MYPENRRINGLTPFLFVALTFFVLAVAVNSLFGQSKKCDSDYKDSVEYKLVQNYKTDLPPYIRSLRVVVKQENINREFMIRLARTLRHRFCTDNEITAMIFDSKRVARTIDEGQFLMGRVKVPEVRGFYTLTSYTLANQGREESIEFSTKRGNPTNEVVVKLSPN